eukprot:19785-Heterococcus_DN1.PRE.1
MGCCYCCPLHLYVTGESSDDTKREGFSRIPVYGSSRDDIVGILMTKDLIFIDPEDETPVKNFVQIFGRSLQAYKCTATVCGLEHLVRVVL